MWVQIIWCRSHKHNFLCSVTSNTTGGDTQTHTHFEVSADCPEAVIFRGMRLAPAVHLRERPFAFWTYVFLLSPPLIRLCGSPKLQITHMAVPWALCCMTASILINKLINIAYLMAKCPAG